MDLFTILRVKAELDGIAESFAKNNEPIIREGELKSSEVVLALITVHMGINGQWYGEPIIKVFPYLDAISKPRIIEKVLRGLGDVPPELSVDTTIRMFLFPRMWINFFKREDTPKAQESLRELINSANRKEIEFTCLIALGLEKKYKFPTVNNSNKSKLSLSDIWEKHLANVDASDKAYVQRHGFILAISLCGSEKKTSKNGADTYVVNDGYVTKPREKNEEEVTIPYLTSWNGFGICPNEEGKVTLTHYEHAGHMVPELEGVPINWNLNLDANFLKLLLNSDKKEHKSWQEFCQFLSDNQKVQLHLLVVLEADPNNGRGKLQEIPGVSDAKHTAFRIQLRKEDILSCSLVTPGPEYLNKIDRPTTVMERLKGREVEEGDAVKVVSAFVGLTEQLKQKAEKVKAAQQEAVTASVQLICNVEVETEVEENEFEAMGM